MSGDVGRTCNAGIGLAVWLATAGVLLLVGLNIADMVRKPDQCPQPQEEPSSQWTDMHVTLGKAAADRGEHENARRFLEEAIKFAPDDVDLRFEYLQMFVRQAAESPSSIGQADLDTLAYALDVLKARDGGESTRSQAVARARLVLRQGRLEEAQSILDKARGKWPDYAHVWLATADLERVAGRKLEALEAYQKAAKAAPENLAAINNLGVALVELERAQEGLAQFEKALKLRDNAASRLNAADALQRLGRNREALLHLQAGARLNPHLDEFKRRIGALRNTAN